MSYHKARVNTQTGTEGAGRLSEAQDFQAVNDGLTSRMPGEPITLFTGYDRAEIDPGNGT